MQTPRSSPAGSTPSIAADARRSTLNVPSRLTRITVSNGSNGRGPRLPAVFSAQPMPAPHTEIRNGPAAAAAPRGPHRPGRGRGQHGVLHLRAAGHVAADERGAVAQLGGERLPALGVEV